MPFLSSIPLWIWPAIPALLYALVFSSNDDKRSTEKRTGIEHMHWFSWTAHMAVPIYKAVHDAEAYTLLLCNTRSKVWSLGGTKFVVKLFWGP